MQQNRAELTSLIEVIEECLTDYHDASLASSASRQQLASQLASRLCLDAGIDQSIKQGVVMMDDRRVALWCKRHEIEALEKANAGGGSAHQSNIGFVHDYWSGKAMAFSQVWEYLVFNGRAPTPELYNKANNEWCGLVKNYMKVKR